MKDPKNSGQSGGGSRASIFASPGFATILLICISLFNYIDRQVLAAVVPEVRQAFFSDPSMIQGGVTGWLMGWLQHVLGGNPDNAMIGLLAMAFMVTYMFAAPIFGLLRWNRWQVILAGVALWSIATGMCGLAGSFGALLVYRMFVGVGEAGYGPVAPTILSDLYPIEKRGRMMAWFYMAIPVGSALGFVLGGYVGSVWGWQWAFFVVVPPGLLLSAVCLFMKDPKQGASDALTHDASEHRASLRDYAIFMRSPSFVINTVAQTLMTFAIGGIGFWMPTYIHEFRGVSSLAEVNMIFGAILVVSGISATLLGGIIGDKLKARFSGSYFLVSGVAMCVGFPLFLGAMYMPFPTAWVFLFAACFCLFFNTGPSNTILANVIHPALRASAFALNIFIIHAFGDVISPLVIGAITDASGKDMNAAFLVVSFLVLAGGIVWLCGAPFLARDEKRALEQLNK